MGKRMRIIILFLTVSASQCFGSTPRENFEGVGTLQCFGNLTLELEEGQTEGVARCRPEFENADNGISYAPQGFIADGEDGSHWVVVDDRGTADCEGQITFNTGDHNLGYCSYPPVAAASTREMAAMESFCGHFTCQGVIQLACTMGSGCHGASYTLDK